MFADLIEHGDKVDVPLVDLGVGGAWDEGGVVVHRHGCLQVVQDPCGVSHRHRTHHHGRDLRARHNLHVDYLDLYKLTNIVREEVFFNTGILSQVRAKLHDWAVWQAVLSSNDSKTQ